MASNSILSDDRLAQLKCRYQDYEVSPLSYATVEQYCDSVDHIGKLASMSGDLKDAQRPWMVKAILAAVPVGSRLLEIGAGEPTVAHLLTRLGYEVTVVDPYDGSGNGPIDVQLFRRQYAPVEIVENRFDSAIELEGHWDCFYSISVLEHIPLDKIKHVFAGMQKFGRPGWKSIHAVDHVLLGAGAKYHHEMLNVVARCSGFGEMQVEALVDAAREDVETYFLSAAGHNRWRGHLPYQSFPMRRCISVQFYSQSCA